MRILWVKAGGVWPLTSGGRLLSFNIITQLSQRHQVSVVTSHGPGESPHHVRGQLSHCERVELFAHAPPKRGTRRFAVSLARSWLSPLPVDLWRWRLLRLRKGVAELLEEGDFDVCVADSLVAMPNVPWPCPVPLVLSQQNVEHMLWKRLGRVVPSWQRALVELESRKMRRYEARACARATLTIAVSQADRDRLRAISPGATVCAVPSGVDTAYFAPRGEPEVPGRLVFTGSMDWYPNEDAVRHFIDAILPAIRREAPHTTVSIVGRDPSSRLRAAAARADVQITGTVADVRPYVGQAEVFVVPLRIGGGTRLKILEGLAMGKAVVSTTIGAEGLPLVPGTHLLQADDPPEFARAVVALLREPRRRSALGAAGRRLVREYSWAEVGRDFEARCAQAAGLDPRGG
jgi:polysaccharide biosynthesis protein PslH